MRWIKTYEAFGDELETAVQVAISQFGEVNREDVVYTGGEWEITNIGDERTMAVPSDLVWLRLAEADWNFKRDFDAIDNFMSMLKDQCPGVFCSIDPKYGQLVLGRGKLEDYCLEYLKRNFVSDGSNNAGSGVIYTWKPEGVSFSKGLVYDLGREVLVISEVWDFLGYVMCLGHRSTASQKIVARWISETLGVDKDFERTYFKVW